MKPENISRREAVKLSLAGIASLGAGASFESTAHAAPDAMKTRPFLTPAAKFQDVSRGNPKPHTLTGEALIKARLTPETWRLEITADSTPDEKIKEMPKVARQFMLADGSALDLAALQDLGKKHRVMFLKAMQCLNIATPLGQGLWEGVPLREVLRLCGKISNVRRIYFWGFHNDDPKQLFQSSLSFTEAMETAPGELPAFLAWKLNGEPLSLLRGGPVRMVVPWAHGFKSIKWLRHIVLTNDYRMNDTYAQQNNDPESHLKTAAYLDEVAPKTAVGQTVFAGGLAVVGLSGLQRVEYWLRPDSGNANELSEDDPVWDAAQWLPCAIEEAPADWSAVLPAGYSAKEILGFDATTGRPKSWPLRYSMVSWSASLRDLKPGKYELRVRAVDLNSYAQPEPRSNAKTGRNGIQAKRFEITA